MGQKLFDFGLAYKKEGHFLFFERVKTKNKFLFDGEDWGRAVQQWKG